LKSLTGKELCKILENNGWCLKKITVSHHVYMKVEKKERISVPVHGNKDLKIGLLKAILRIAEIDL
jgi:predicted RNA binding protein YcfA (HicA-like mRNA interferase family)